MDAKAANVNVKADPVDEETSVEKKDIEIPVQGKSNLNTSADGEPVDYTKAKQDDNEPKVNASFAKISDFSQELQDYRKSLVK